MSKTFQDWKGFMVAFKPNNRPKPMAILINVHRFRNITKIKT